MFTRQATYLDFLETPKTQMVIPVFQRVYTWGVWQCAELLEDILAAGSGDSSHFIGSVVYTREDTEGTAGAESLFTIIDGQQRTTTVTLLLIALRDYLETHAENTEGIDPLEIQNRYLTLIANDGCVLPKFTAARADNDTLAALLFRHEMPEDYKLSNYILNNYNFFAHALEEGLDISELWRGLESLFAIVVELDGEDNPQSIFESINSKGMNLETSDLLRNKLLFGSDDETQERLLETYWDPIESLFENDETHRSFNAALHYWLDKHDDDMGDFSVYEFYSVFRKYLDDEYEGETEELMGEMLDACQFFMRTYNSPLTANHIKWAQGNASADLGNGKGFYAGQGSAASYYAALR